MPQILDYNNKKRDESDLIELQSLDQFEITLKKGENHENAINNGSNSSRSVPRSV
jgi:hypothetical protein